MHSDEGYSVEIDQISKEDWSQYIIQFEDASIYQTWSYGAVRWGEKNLSHIVLKQLNKVKSLAQVSIKKLPLIGAGLAYIPWGPLWRKRGEDNSSECLMQILRAIKEEYVIKRGLFLKMAPNEIEDSASQVRQIIEREGFDWKSHHYRTILLDLDYPLEEIRNKLNKKWGDKLVAAEDKNLKIKEGTGNDLYESMCIPYQEMLQRKQFLPGVSINEFKLIQKDLPVHLKMRIMVCYFEGRPIASLLGSSIGAKGILILGGNNEMSLKLGGSHLLPWRMIEWMKTSGAKMCDLGGYDPIRNPKTAHFKEGVSGRDVRHVGQFEGCQNLNSLIIGKLGFTISKSLNRSKLGILSLINKLKIKTKIGRKVIKKNLFSTLTERGFISQTSNIDMVKKLLDEPITFCMHFNSVINNFCVKDLVAVMFIVRMQKEGHRPLIVVEGIDTLFGSIGKDNERNKTEMLHKSSENVETVRQFLSQFIDFTEGRGIYVDLAYWLTDLRYAELLSEIQKQNPKGWKDVLENRSIPLGNYETWYFYNHHYCQLFVDYDSNWDNLLKKINIPLKKKGPQLYGLSIPSFRSGSFPRTNMNEKNEQYLDLTRHQKKDFYDLFICGNENDANQLLPFLTFIPMSKINKVRSIKHNRNAIGKLIGDEITKCILRN